MSTPYDREFVKTTTGVNEIVELDFPGRCDLTRVSIVKLGGGAITANIFNRKFDGTPHAVKSIVEVPGVGVRINLPKSAKDFDDVKVGDLLTVAGNSEAAYNAADHRIVSIDPSVEPRFVETDKAFVTVGTGGTVVLAIPAAEQEVNRVIPEISGASPQFIIPTGSGDTATFVNQDPLGNVNIGVKRKLYMKLNLVDTYKIALSAVLGVAGEG